MKMWKVWDYDGKYLGVVAGANLGDAIKAARSRWADELTCSRLFDFVLVRQ